MIVLYSVSKVQGQLREQVKAIRVSQGLTQAGLANRSGVPLPTLRKYEQTGRISLESFLKILMVLGCLETFVQALKDHSGHFESIDDVLNDRPNKPRKRGWRR
ncbi:MAG: helix-turn-helix transcriptional regulator [Gammaproteobacteria bacterium]|nr:helix-turn-helix transcriptional regulator [Gammaproteobacteria bacterium]MCY4219399.1 helix-turn-helix transcriptional regulator [Gammaproteobacteria bacterium]MCY4274141.1 helix-turn-helix transcriptional regulator [Gammaproteobacteria bacterium]